MFHTRKEVQACYRFSSNDLVNETKIIEPHLKMTVKRASQNPVVLCLSDTTSLNYTTRKTLKDSGYISNPTCPLNPGYDLKKQPIWRIQRLAKETLLASSLAAPS